MIVVEDRGKLQSAGSEQTTKRARIGEKEAADARDPGAWLHQLPCEHDSGKVLKSCN